VRITWFAVLAVACSPARAPLPTEATPGVVFPVHVAEGRGEGASVASTEPPAPPPKKPAPPSPPDPEPLRSAKQYEIAAVWENYAVRVESVRPLELKKPMASARRVGRFAVELWVGRELIERVRFDFPLLAAEDHAPRKRRPLHEPPSFAGSILRAKVLVPASPRARRAVIVDRATGNETPLAWPPSVAPAPTAPATPSSAAPASTAPVTPSSASPAAAPSGAAHPR
jgi:hypothetical protein